MCTSRALGQFPFVAKQVREEVIAPLRRRGGPNNFQAAADRVASYARAEFTPPAEALLLEGGGFRLWPQQGGIASAVSFAKGVTSGDQCDGFLVIHRHAGKRFTDVARSSNWI